MVEGYCTSGMAWCVIYLKVADCSIWSTLAMFRAMGLPSSVSSTASVSAVLFFSFVAWAAVEVWGTVLIYTLAQICNRWLDECALKNGSTVVEDGLRLRRDGRALGDDESDDDSLDTCNTTMMTWTWAASQRHVVLDQMLISNNGRATRLQTLRAECRRANTLQTQCLCQDLI